jgi:hypothetical protein
MTTTHARMITPFYTMAKELANGLGQKKVESKLSAI